jgi:mitogen-activated protein kinase kinase kinase
LKKLQTPLYEEFYNSTLNTMGAPTAVGTENSENPTHLPSLPPKSRSPKRVPSRRLSAVVDAPSIASPGRQTNHVANESSIHNRALQEIQPPQLSEWKEFLHDGQQETLTSRCVCHYLMPGLS